MTKPKNIYPQEYLEPLIAGIDLKYQVRIYLPYMFKTPKMFLNIYSECLFREYSHLTKQEGQAYNFKWMLGFAQKTKAHQNSFISPPPYCITGNISINKVQ